MILKLFEGLHDEGKLTHNFAATGQTASVMLKPEDLREAATRLFKDEWFIEDISVLDVVEGFAAQYHFAHFVKPGRLTIRVLAPRETPVFPSIASIYPGAEWHERESADFYAVEFAGNPNPAPLLLSDDMIGAAPLRKEEKDRKPYFDLLPTFTCVDCADDHPLKKLELARIEAAKIAAAKAAEAEAKAAEAKKAAAKPAAESA